MGSEQNMRVKVEVINQPTQFKFRLVGEMLGVKGRVLKTEFSRWQNRGILSHKFEINGETWFVCSSEWEGTFEPFVPFTLIYAEVEEKKEV
jgi:hypothetical protein